MNKCYKNENGFSILSLLIVLGFLSVMFVMGAERLVMMNIKQTQAEPYLNRLLNLKNQLENYQVMKYQGNKNGIDTNLIEIFPATQAVLEDELANNNLIRKCSGSDYEDGLCSKLDETPYNEKLAYTVKSSVDAQGARYQYAEIEIPLPRKDDRLYYNVYMSVLGKLPNVRFVSGGDTTLLWRIDRISHQPAYEEGLKAQLDKRYLMQNGDKALTEDWDVSGSGNAAGYGNPKAILNVKEVTVRLQNGKQQRLSEGVVGYLVGEHDQIVERHSCSAGLVSDLVVTPKDLQAQSAATKYSSSGSYKVGAEPFGADSWKLYIYHNVKLQTTQKWETINDGYVSVMRVCRR
ncbi:type II secretion system protein [Vibrio vulnificus]